MPRLMLEKVRETRALLHFVREHLPHYGPLVSLDMQRFREEIVKATVGVGLAATAGLIFACFLSVALIVSAWNGPHRVAVAWLVCAGWGILTLAGVGVARKAVSGPPPFHLVSAALMRDYARFAASIATHSTPT
jgi:hypothetical protein